MKKIFTLSMLFVAALVASAQTPFYTTHAGSRHEQTERADGETMLMANSVELTYLEKNEDMWNDQGISFNDKWRIGIAIVFPTEKIAQYVGSKVTALSFGWNTRKFSPEATCFVRTGLDKENVAEATKKLVNSAADAGNWYGSWNKVTLAEPYVIQEGDSIVIGYFADFQPVGNTETCIPFSSYGNSYSRTQYVMNCSVPEEEGGNMWIELWNEITGKATAPLFAKATLVDEGGNVVDLCSVEDCYCRPILKRGEATGGFMKLTNRGTNNISKIGITYAFEGQEQTKDINLSTPIEPARTVTMSMPFIALGSGDHTFEVRTVNGKKNNIAKPVEYNAIGVPAEVGAQYTPKVLVEYYCAENDHNSAKYYEDVLAPGFAKHREQLVVVNQHMNDQFMIYDPDESNPYDDATMFLIDFANGDLSQVYMPVMTVNRTVMPNYYVNPAISTNPAEFVITPQFVDAIMYEPLLDTPTFASVNAELSLDEAKKNLTIKVKGDIAEDVLPAGEQLYLSVYVMEDNVYTNSQEKPDDEDFLARFPGEDYWQHNIIRLALTPMYGARVGRGGAFEKEYEAELEDEWKLDDMSVIVFLTRSKNNTSTTRNVVNANQTLMTTCTGVNAAKAVNAGEAALYNLNGVRVSGKPAAGVYVVTKDGESRTMLVK